MHAMIVIFCTCPDDRTARQLAAGLVENHLAACVNVLPGIRSIYRWQDTVQDDGESLLVIKTGREGYPALEKWLTGAHPYDLPEIVALPVEAGLPAYLDWVVQETSGRNDQRNAKKR